MLGSLALFWLGAEAALRILQARPMTATVLTSFVQPDAALGWVGIPGAAARFATADFDVSVSHDRSGLRRVSIPWGLEQDAGRAVTWCLGDSFCWGWGVGDGESFVDEMNRNGGGRRHFRNLGIPGYAQAQEIVALRRLFSQGARPTTIILLLSQGDLAENVDSGRDLPRPYFVVSGTQAQLREPSGPPSRRWRLRSQLQRTSLAYNYVHYLVRRSELVLGSRARELWGGDRAGASVSGAVGTEQSVAFHQALRMILELCGAQGVRVVVAGDCQEPEAALANELCRGLEVPFVDLAPAFAPVRGGQKDDSIAFRHDRHWTPLAHRLAARALLSFLNSGGDSADP